MRVLIRRLWHLLRLSSVEADLAEEMDVHRELKERDVKAELRVMKIGETISV